MGGGDPSVIESVGEVPVTFNLGMTRGTLTPAVNDDELISSYMIVVAQNGTVVSVLTELGLNPAEEHSVDAQLPAGSCKVYAFANIPFANEGDWLYGRFLVGQSLPDMSTLYYGDDNFGNGYSGRIPMSNSVQGLNLNLTSGSKQSFDIEVVRMVAKVEFVFMNSSSENISIGKIAMGPLTTVGSTDKGFIPLSWYNDATALSFYSVDDKKYGTDTYTHTIPTPITIDAGDVATKPSTSFYVIESNPDPVTNAFNLAFTVSHGSVTDEVRYALLDKSQVATGTNLDGDNDRSPFIRRNDWIRIPIDLGDYEFRLQARSYPPIGGYPEANVDEFKVEFSYHGYFSIMPTIRKYGTTEWISLDNPIITRCEVSVDTEESKDLTDIFTDSGRPVRKLNEIVGTIKPGVHGTAIVTLEIDIKVSDSVTRTLKRQMYVTV